MFRFNYSRDFLQWVLKPPHYNTAWYVGVRVAPKAGATKPGKLLGFVSAIPSKIRVYDKYVLYENNKILPNLVLPLLEPSPPWRSTSSACTRSSARSGSPRC